MKVQDLLTSITINKKNGQLSTCIKKNNLKKAGITEKEFLNMKVDTKLKSILFED